MVRVTVYIEGGINFPGDTEETLSPDNSVIFRESFHKLFLQNLPGRNYDLIVQQAGGVLLQERSHAA